MKKVYATGKRKTSVAKVWLQPGTGKIIINGFSLDAWLGGLEAKKKRVLQPLVITEHLSLVDITATVKGGGISGQADAVRHGIAKALNEYDSSLRKILKPAGLLTRDSRIVERKKPGKKKARRSPQFSKR
jgi:small subunit ribosomal protein S9